MQNGVWTGSYVFYLNLLGKRYRKVVRVKTSAVADLCRKWEKDTISFYCDPVKKHRLFEKIDEFLEYAKKSKNLPYLKIIKRLSGSLNNFLKICL